MVHPMLTVRGSQHKQQQLHEVQNDPSNSEPQVLVVLHASERAQHAEGGLRAVTMGQDECWVHQFKQVT